MLRKRHANKPTKWLFKKYWTKTGIQGIFGVIVRYKNKYKLYRVTLATTINIRRHIKIKADANPYMPEYGKYFWFRRHVKEATLLPELSARQMKLVFN
jgi:RNA-directed DNA polymerase